LNAESPDSLRFLKSHKTGPRAFTQYLEQGGLPGICFFRDAHVRTGKLEAHLDTLLNCDIRQVYSTTLLHGSLRSLLEYTARHQSLPFEIADVISRTRARRPGSRKACSKARQTSRAASLPTCGRNVTTVPSSE
jgi:predicted AAA+ superfamily ATPase